VVINLPKVKTHSMMLLTLGVKNMFGCVPGMRKAQWHLRAGVDHASFAGMLVELCRLVRPALTIADGIMGMEGEGPGSGNPRQLGLLVASGNPYALDTAICRIIGAPLAKAPTIQAARQRGFAGADPKHIEVLGHRIKNGEITPFRLPTRFDAQWNLPRFVKKSLTHAFVPKPVIKEALCKVCMACGEVCPPQAISVRDKKINIDYRSCIRCYCCQEVCPEGAVRLQAGWFARLSS
jgi:ferredoxin